MERVPLRSPRISDLTKSCCEFKGIAKTQFCARTLRPSQSFDSESAERRASVRMRSICAELLSYATGIVFAISDAVDILIFERKILPIGVAIPFFVVWRSQF
jgi:hypothetical protein